MCDGANVLLHVRCGGCSKMYRQLVVLPTGRTAPADGDELMEHPEIRNMQFACPKCETPSAEIVAFKVVETRNAAA